MNEWKAAEFITTGVQKGEFTLVLEGLREFNERMEVPSESSAVSEGRQGSYYAGHGGFLPRKDCHFVSETAQAERSQEGVVSIALCYHMFVCKQTRISCKSFPFAPSR